MLAFYIKVIQNHRLGEHAETSRTPETRRPKRSLSTPGKLFGENSDPGAPNGCVLTPKGCFFGMLLGR